MLAFSLADAGAPVTELRLPVADALRPSLTVEPGRLVAHDVDVSPYTLRVRPIGALNLFVVGSCLRFLDHPGLQDVGEVGQHRPHFPEFDLGSRNLSCDYEIELLRIQLPRVG